MLAPIMRLAPSRSLVLLAARARLAPQLQPARLAHALRPLRPSTVLVRAAAADPSAPPAPLFQDLGLCPELLDALQEKGLSSATEIQAAAVPELLRDRRSDFMLASHTGSGKTLAYLLPIGEHNDNIAAGPLC
jgi:ATP-dependent helicase YprA (DUF1998 family)